jgi:radical SAM superfamily enzyme YgiQ (UPF0313 family)
MKAYLIKASAPGPFKEYKKATGGPSQNIFSVAATTPAGVELEMCDETIGMKPKLNIKADIVALFFHTPDAVHAYKLADKYRAKGITVILGGLHPTFLPQEAQKHADALLIGEAEGTWEELLQDYQQDQLKPLYVLDQPVDLATVKPYPIDLIPPSKYNYVWSVLVSRGCVHRCEYCAVPPFFNGKYRLRPIENIVAEIKALPEGCWVELHADHLAANRDYSLELFKALKPLGVNWVGESTILMVDDDELLQAASESGCKQLLIGIETPSQAALNDAGKEFVAPDQIRDKIRRFHEFGIEVTSSMIFGFDSHTPEIFQETLDFCRHVEIDEVEAVLLIPFPGTPLYQRLKDEGRILDDNWANYDGSNVVFQPKKMTVEELNEGSDWFWREIQKPVVQKNSPDGDNNRKPSGPAKAPRLTSGGNPFRYWKSMLALVCIAIALVFDLYWIWGVLFVIWAVQDFRNGYTHLLDNIPRSDSPILYWTVVLLWLGLGIWVLVLSTTPYLSSYADTGPVVERQLQPAAPVLPKKKIPAPTIKPEAIKPLVSYQNQRFDFTVSVPEKWQASEKIAKDSVTFDFQNPSQSGTLTVLATDLKGPFPLKDFILYMEKEISKEMPFVNSGNMTKALAPAAMKDCGNTLTFREYQGEYQDYPIKALIGYGVKAKNGYIMLATHGISDAQMKQKLHEIIGSFKLI